MAELITDYSVERDALLYVMSDVPPPCHLFNPSPMIGLSESFFWSSVQCTVTDPEISGVGMSTQVGVLGALLAPQWILW